MALWPSLLPVASAGNNNVFVYGTVRDKFEKSRDSANSLLFCVDFNVPNWFDRLYAYITGNQNPREIVQWLSIARHLRENLVFVAKVFPKLEGGGVSDMLNGADPAFNRLIANINTELKNQKRSVLENFAIDAGYKIIFEKTNCCQECLDAAAAFELTPDLGMI